MKLKRHLGHFKGFVVGLVLVWATSCATHKQAAINQLTQSQVNLSPQPQVAAQPEKPKVETVKWLDDGHSDTFRLRIDSLVSASGITDKAFVGIHIQVVGEGVLYDRNGSKLFLPASTAKLFTGVAALHYLGQEYRFKTEIYKDDAGRLYIKGFGDPSLTTGDLYSIAKHLQLMGMQNISEIIVDDSYFDTLWLGHGWMWDDEPYPYMARISALSVDHNVIEVIVTPSKKVGGKPHVSVYPESEFVVVENFAKTTDTGRTKLKVTRTFDNGKNIIVVKGRINRRTRSVSVWRNLEQPSLHVGYVFDKILNSVGIQTSHRVRRDTVPENIRDTVFVHRSRPLFEIVADMLKPSSNFVAEQLLKSIGAKCDTVPGTAVGGIGAIKKLLVEHHIGDTSEFRLVDGSGLSRYNLVSPRLLVSLLVWAYENHKLSPEILTALPIGGVDGTLYKRMTWDKDEKRVRAKTGSMTSVSALAGLVWTKSGKVVAFAIMANNYLGSSKPIRNFQDALVELLTEY